MHHRNHKIIPVLVMVIMAVTSCTDELSPGSYIKWMEDPDHGLCKSKTMGIVDYSIQYKTPDYIRLKNNGTNTPNSESNKNIHYFTLTMEPTDKKSPLLKTNLQSEEEYFNRVQYYNFYFKNDISLFINGKQFFCEHYFFESTGNLTPGLRFTFGFDPGDIHGDLRVAVNEKVFGAGGLNFTFKEKNIKNIPVLKYKAS